jgi:hypothetical protein
MLFTAIFINVNNGTQLYGIGDFDNNGILLYGIFFGYYIGNFGILIKSGH